MSSKHLFFVPIEWGKGDYTPEILEFILKAEISREQIIMRVQGIKVNIEGVTARLRYHNLQPWMRKDQDNNSRPNSNEYFGLNISYDDNTKTVDSHTLLRDLQGSSFFDATSHRYLYLVPREWLALPWVALESTLHEEISSYYSKHGKLEGAAIRVRNVTAFLQCYNGHFWMRKYQDQRDKPHLTEYLAILLPCIDCSPP
ncbi:uncharacterized protein LOC130665485 [Microplitis mediator]|uniref:uncharacterized protein LOC130665485 n=1 Tax=Microplitis mediator TaxID=375433 RepID=UPI002553B7EA|nr:uncharacterized protein LOC130665485 [Microplitis mediator]